ncbi:thiamine pyrophosphate-dependent dehydrogenase E1 component subunit alpha [Mycobacterium sp. GA-2829]|uniref:thiamine pyrophosphate-dependent dehydrogenase E1 component subunit alpha n=1 Tax=Mycobacterium sp. GA-2829 TaxID=1772283 RepID=UPI0007401FE3|nr:thiamine pyrophosphate-dependent enzyme [Mycobacterium sp. GA-2829]KUI39245.1 pyruvate dehydrogenase (acetyl-transferring) E1 component subunit alpha [Mycobacterium sp. GA-2829]
MTDLVDAPMVDTAFNSPWQVLDADGALHDHAHTTAGRCRAFYRDMVLARRLDQEAYHLQRQGELGLWLSCRGQEAAQVGSIRAVRPSDHVFPSYREQAAALCRGLGPAELLTQWRGTAHGGWDPQPYRFHISSLVLSTQLLHATGYALGVAADRRKDPTLDEIVLCYFGDGSASQGDASEALNWAAVTNAPILFFCQNNQWAISTPSAAQSRTPLHVRAAGFGLRTTLVDGNDVVAVHAATAAAADRIRAGGPPELIEAVTYRMAGHSTSDDPTRYRSADDVAVWEARDPLVRVRRLLDAQGWADEAFHTALEEEATVLAETTRTACRSLDAPALEDTFLNTFVRETAALRAEREQYTTWRNSFA